MKNKKRLINHGKNFIIVLLLISAVLLFLQTGLMPGGGSSALFSSVAGYFRGIGTGASPSSGEDSTVYAQAARPRYIAINLEGSGRYGIKYDEEALTDSYGRFSIFLGEALGSSDDPEQVPMRDWELALGSSGVFFDFIYPQRLSVLAGWLGTDMKATDAATHTARRFYLAQNGDGVDLYYIRARDGGVYRCSTALSFSSVSQRMADYSFPESPSSFAFELGSSLSLVDPYTLILDKQPEVYELSVKNPVRSAVSTDALLSMFEMNSFVATPYEEPDGTTVYVDGSSTLRIYADGRVVFQQTEPENLKLSVGGTAPQKQVDEAYKFALGSAGAYCGEAVISLTSLSYSTADSTYSISFDYMADGIPIYASSSGSAVELQISGGAITYASLLFKEYTTEESVSPLPDRQAAAVVQAAGGGEPVLIYEDNGEKAAPCWVIN